jgi:hypothetical protein
MNANERESRFYEAEQGTSRDGRFGIQFFKIGKFSTRVSPENRPSILDAHSRLLASISGFKDFGPFVASPEMSWKGELTANERK